MKIKIVFTEPPYTALTSTPATPDEKIIFIQDPYNITMLDGGRRILGVDQSTITYEAYCVELKKIIDDTIREQKLNETQKESMQYHGGNL